ncbi:MAG: PHP domain-containing protein, partial [Chloroflexi bacterium]
MVALLRAGRPRLRDHQPLLTSGYPIDLHTHSIASDGALTPTELIARAAERGVRIQALADHDTLLGVAEAVAEGERRGVRVIPATELNTESEWGDVHVLAYFVLGYAVSLDRVREIAQGGSLGRPHLAQALFESGHVPTYDSAFDTLISKDSPAYVSRVGLAPLEAVALARTHGGVPSLAHPGTVVDVERLLPQLVPAGLVGMECYYASHTPAFTAQCLRLSVRYGLVPTGGSDFH